MAEQHAVRGPARSSTITTAASFAKRDVFEGGGRGGGGKTQQMLKRASRGKIRDDKASVRGPQLGTLAKSAPMQKNLFLPKNPHLNPKSPGLIRFHTDQSVRFLILKKSPICCSLDTFSSPSTISRSASLRPVPEEVCHSRSRCESLKRSGRGP